uniref:beta-galactoside alpha-(2,6)-sialyltransferase n=1 Tax=Alexandrium catenella TaxID=2925 RepID=A0A7S1SC55_ALECA
MLRRSFGRKIDAADAVMRFGTPPMSGKYQADAGRKETFRLLNTQVQGALPRGLGLGAFDSGFFLVSDAPEGAAKPGVLPLGEIHAGLMQLLRQTFPRFEYKALHEVSSGMTGIAFLLHVCDEVALYEMIPSRLARGMPWHYWEPGGDARQNHWHNSLFFEQALWRLLANASAAAVDSGVVRLRGFRKLKHRCGPQPSLPPPSGVPDPPAAAPTCGDLSVAIDGEEAYSRVTDSQRCSLYCRLEHLVPVGKAVRELIGRVHYDTCAVVSNSGALLKWRHGAEIDRADAVMRFNLATTDLATRPHAGFKETFRLLNSRLQSQAVSGLRLGGFDKGLFLVTDGWPRDNMPVGDPSIAKSELFAAQPGIVPMGEVQHGLMEVLVRTFPEFKHHLGHEVTSGMLGIALMLHLCEEVVLYEMVPSKAAKGMPWHYWERWGDATKNSWHNSLQFEYAVWRLLAGPHDTSQTGVLRLEGFRRHKQQCL